MLGIFKRKEHVKELRAPIDGQVIPVAEVSDDVFSSRMLGDGIAVHPTSCTVVSPADGEITVTMDSSNHAVSMKVEDGLDLLIHIGLDTVNLKGEGFTSHISMGQKVKTGDKLITFDKVLLESQGYCTDVIMVVLDNPALPKIEYSTGMTAAAGGTIVATW